MFRELFRSRKFVLGLVLVLAGLSALLLTPMFENSEGLHSVVPATKTTFYAPSPVRAVEYLTETSSLKKRINRKIDEVIELIDEIID